MKLKPWYKVVTPREDLREGRPLDASEFAVHLDQVRDGRAHPDYQKADRFFERTFLTRSLRGTAAEVVRRLAGETTGSSAVFNMATQFGGGKTHALTLLYHLACQGPKAQRLQGVPAILAEARVAGVSEARTAVFVGTEFDSLTGRGGSDGTPLRRTPWGEVAYQLGGDDGFRAVAEHDEKLIAPSGEVIRQFLPADKPCLVLMDELMNYVSRNRKSGLAAQLYNFLQNLSEEARGRKGMVLVASVPASELEMTADDMADYSRLKKLLDRVGKAVFMAAESETSEIIRRRLFEWDPQAVNQDGRVLLNRDAIAVCAEHADWVVAQRNQVPAWFVDHAREAFDVSYPFHPVTLSVFERKWQGLPRFQQTRGMLRLLALWVAHSYQQGFKGAQRDTLIGLGTAPLEDPMFRAAVFEQLGESRLEGAVTTDVCGRKESHAVRLDAEAEETLRKAQVHKKTATAIFFESNGGQNPAKGAATVPEIRLAVAEPELDIGNVETALEALTDACYYLTVERNQYRFGLRENLNKRYADRRATVADEEIEQVVRTEIQKVFAAVDGAERVFFPDKSAQVPDRPVLTLAVVGPDHALQDDPQVLQRLDTMTREYGTSSRVFKSALLWVVPEGAAPMREEARRSLAWSAIADEGLALDEAQARQLQENVQKSKRDVREAVWRAYKNVILLGTDNRLKTVDLGPIHSSAAESVSKLVLNSLRQTGDIEKDVSPRFLVRNWPGMEAWSTKAVRDAFYSSPQFPRLVRAEAVRDAIARGVADGTLAYVGRKPDGAYDPFLYKAAVSPADIEISEDMFVITGETAERKKEPPRLVRIVVSPAQVHIKRGVKQTFSVTGFDQFDRETATGPVQWACTGGSIDARGVLAVPQDEGNYAVTASAGGHTGGAEVTALGDDRRPPPPPPPTATTLTWTGDVPPQRWMNFYTKVLSRFVGAGAKLKVTVTFEASLPAGAAGNQGEETKAALREIGLDDDIKAGRG